MLNRRVSALTRVLLRSAFSSEISSSLSSSCSRQRFSSLVSTANSCRVTRGLCYGLNAAVAVQGTEQFDHAYPTHSATTFFYGSSVLYKVP